VVTASIPWIDLGTFKINMGIYLDNLAIILNIYRDRETIDVTQLDEMKH
jgi:NADH:ubiquinone oxidoreductase subunit K